MRMSSSSPGKPPGGGLAKSRSGRCCRSPWENADLTSATQAAASMLASICSDKGTSLVEGVGTVRLSK